MGASCGREECGSNIQTSRHSICEFEGSKDSGARPRRRRAWRLERDVPDLSIPETPIDRRNASGERVRPLTGGTRDSAEEPEARIMSVQAGTRDSELRRPQFCLA